MVSGAEAHRIGKALESVAGWVSEIVVVVDDRTQDGTERVVERHGGQVVHETWKGFAGQKNSAADHCTQSWLLNLDADEAVSPELRREIETLFANPGRLDGSDAFRFARCTQYFGRWIRHGDWYPDHVTRLWKKGRMRWVGEEPHAYLDVRGKAATLRGDLLHRPMESYEHQVSKTIAYANDFVRQHLASGRPVRPWDIYLRPGFRFFRSYVLRLGFLDGWQGYSIACMTAFYTFLRYAKIREETTRAVGTS